MSIEILRRKVEDYCNNIPCEKCVLKVGGWKYQNSEICPCLCICESDEEDLNRAIELIDNSISSSCESVNHPTHYNDGKIEVIDFIEDQKLGFHLGNAVKYICRAGKKDPAKEVEDLKKAAWYINRRIKEIEEETV